MKNSNVLFICSVMVLAIVLPVAVYSRAAGQLETIIDEPDPFGKYINNPLEIRMQLHMMDIRENTAGVLMTSMRLVTGNQRPDGIGWSNAYSHNEGRAWGWEESDLSSPAGATDSDDECESETDEMCADSGHGTGSGNATRTQHELEDGGGCTCTQTCTQDGAVAFVSSTSPCG